MDNGTAIAIIIAIAAVLVATWFYLDRRKTRRLRNKFGPEYDRTVQTQPNARQAERVLESREKRVAKFNIRPLSRDEMERFTERWRKVQERFVDDPAGAVQTADQLINEALSARGYPMSDFEQQAADLSVDYPVVVDHYRAGHATAVRLQQGGCDTEDLRRAMQHYRTLFEQVIGSATMHYQEVLR